MNFQPKVFIPTGVEEGIFAPPNSLKNSALIYNYKMGTLQNSILTKEFD